IFCQMLQYKISTAARLVRVLHQKGNVTDARREKGSDQFIAGNSDDVFTLEHDQRDFVVSISVNPKVDVIIGKHWVRCEKPQVLRMIGNARVKPPKLFCVRPADGAK